MNASSRLSLLSTRRVANAELLARLADRDAVLADDEILAEEVEAPEAAEDPEDERPTLPIEDRVEEPLLLVPNRRRVRIPVPPALRTQRKIKGRLMMFAVAAMVCLGVGSILETRAAPPSSTDALFNTAPQVHHAHALVSPGASARSHT